MSDKIDLTFPRPAISLKLKVDGIFGFPDQWKTTDEANPGMFTYIVRFCHMELQGGKIYPRELTQKQLREQEQAKKKGGKKEAKKEQNPAEIQRLKQLQEKEEAEERRREEAWAQMNQQQRAYSVSQDPFKSPALKFENNATEKKFTARAFVAFEEHVLKSGGQWVYIFKIPTAAEQELQKIKKSKPKTLNLADLNPVCMRAWLNLGSLQSSDLSELELRCKIAQVDESAQTPKPNLEKTYIKISLKLSEPLLPKPDQFNVDKVIRNPPEPSPIPAQTKCMKEMNEELRVALQSLAMEYANMFSRDLNANEEQRSSQIFVANRKNEHIRRKQQFLYDFNVSGKYKVLKERLKKVIVHLCQSKFTDKMQGAKSFTGITSSVRDQFYSEIYNFLVTSYSDTINQMIEEKKQKLKEVLVLNQENQSKAGEQHLQQYLRETQTERFQRIIGEYNLVGNYEYGQQMYKNAVAEQPENIQLKYQYSIFCLKNGLNSLAEVMSWGYVEKYLEHNKGSRVARWHYVLLIAGSDQPKNLKKCWVVLRELIEEEPANQKYLLCASLVLELLNKAECAEKFRLRVFRSELRRQGRLKEEGKHQSEPAADEIPSLNSPAVYSTELKGEEKDRLWTEVLQSFSGLGIFNMVEKIKQKLQSTENRLVKKQNVKMLYSLQQYRECKDQALQLFQDSKDFEMMQIAISCCHQLKEPEHKVKCLKIVLKEAPHSWKPYALLNLGVFYLAAQMYGNCKACITNYLQDNARTGGLSWQLLGISELMSNNFGTAIECFRHSNLRDPFNKEVWIWLAQAYCRINNFVMISQCLNCYIESGEERGRSKLKQLKSALEEVKPRDFYESSMKEKLVKRLGSY